jgi:predicted DNA repair protein MutK
MDDVAVMSKSSYKKKTAGILGDDLAVNAEKASGLFPQRITQFVGYCQRISVK